MRGCVRGRLGGERLGEWAGSLGDAHVRAAQVRARACACVLAAGSSVALARVTPWPEKERLPPTALAAQGVTDPHLAVCTFIVIHNHFDPSPR